MKKCKTCGLIKNQKYFHKKTCNKDGLRSICKMCRKIKSKEYYIENKDKILSCQKEYYIENKDRKLDYAENYHNKNRDRILKYNKRKNRLQMRTENKRKYNNRNQEKIKAMNILTYAIITGKVKRLNCEICNRISEAHHWSYLPENRIDVFWLCRKHHTGKGGVHKNVPINNKQSVIDWIILQKNKKAVSHEKNNKSIFLQQ